jgi:hypothetical protein
LTKVENSLEDQRRSNYRYDVAYQEVIDEIARDLLDSGRVGGAASTCLCEL